MSDGRLATAEAMLCDLGYDWCDGCKDYTTTEYKMVHRRTMVDPEEGVYYCEVCGKERG